MFLCVFIPSPKREGSTFLVITGVKFLQTELKPVRKVSADANLKRFHHKLLSARKKSTIQIDEYRVAKPRALGNVL